MILPVRQQRPRFGSGVFVADSADVIGDVHVGDQSSIWFGAVVRGDVMPVRIGRMTNIQDRVVIHGTYGKHETEIGDSVSIGHGCLIHGCQVGEGSLIGMGTIVMDGACIGENCLVGAGSLVTEGKSFPNGSLILGAPARCVRLLEAEEKENLKKSAENYLQYKKWYQDNGGLYE